MTRDRNERTILCGDDGPAHDGRPTPGGAPVRLRLWGPGHEVTLKVGHICDRLARVIPPRFLDLLEVGTYVYCADQAVPRGGDGADVLGERWRRLLHFRVPVREPDFWASRPVVAALRGALGFLSEDQYEFGFRPLLDPPPPQYYLDTTSPGGARTPEEVVLFSGGIDSLGGAVREAVVGRRRVALVMHRPTEKLRRRHDALRDLLDRRAAPARPEYVPVTINKRKGLSREYTQRSRSFLYACLAATVAELYGLDRIRFYENGVVSLNLPLSPQVVGAKATRTTHPWVLRGFRELLSLVAGRPFGVENPFADLTKAQVVRDIAEAGCGELLAWSTSCTHTWEMSNEHHHCGRCSQCIDRRFAVLAAGQAAHDPASDYQVDLLTGPRPAGEHRTMLASYVESASAVARMGPVEFFGRYGEISRVVRHGGGSADAAAMRAYDLYQRHAAGVCRAVDEAIARYGPQIRSRELPDSCLLRLVCDTAAAESRPDDGPPSAAVTTADPPSGPRLALRDHVFRRKGAAWVVRFAAAEEFILLPSRGADYLHRLISAAGAEHSVCDLVLQVARSPSAFVPGDAGERSDAEAKRAYRVRYEDLREELAAAEADGDEAALERLRSEEAALADELKDRGWGGQPKAERDDRERLRKSFQMAVRRATDEIRLFDRRLAAHLDVAVKCGRAPSYAPAEPVDWDL